MKSIYHRDIDGLTHYYKTDSGIWEAVRSGCKDIEFRVYDHKAKKVKVHDFLSLTNNNTGEQLLVSVISIIRARTWEALYSYAVKNEVKTGFGDIDTFVKTMNNFYSNVDPKSYDGVVAFIIKH